MKKKKILFVISYFLDGGVETVLIEYLRNLLKTKAYDLTLAIAYKIDEVEVYHNRIPKEVKVVYLVTNPILLKYKCRKPANKIIKLADEIFINPIRRYVQSRNLHKLVKKADAVVDFISSQGSFLRKEKTNKIVFIHSAIEENYKRDPKEGEKQKRKIPTYNHIVTISKAMYQEACRFYPEVKDRICMIYNSVDTDELQRASDEFVADERMEKPYILSISRLEEYPKDFSTLIAAYALLRKYYGHTEELYIIGKGPSLQQLQQKTIECGVQDHVHFLGFMSNPYPYIKRCEIFVHSSQYEGLPTVMIEALLLDKMIVATDCPTGPREILNGGKAGILTPVGDIEALAKAMHEALTDKKMQQQFAEGRAAHKRLFTFEANREAFCKLLESK